MTRVWYRVVGRNLDRTDQNVQWSQLFFTASEAADLFTQKCAEYRERGYNVELTLGTLDSKNRYTITEVAS